MRKIAEANRSDGRTVRLMLYESGNGTYLFLYDSLEDVSCWADHWYPAPEEAALVARNQFGVDVINWRIVDDAREGCYEDRIADVPVHQRNDPPRDTK